MPPRSRWKTPSLIPSLAGAAVLLWSHAVAASPSPAGRISGGEAGTGLRGSVLLDARTATYIPPALNPGFFDWAGQKLAIRTRVHDVKFMCGGEGPTLHRAIIYPFLYPFDEIRLLQQGYAVATLALFVVPRQQNHNAPDGSFWEAFSSPEKSRFMAHNASIDAAGREKRIRADLDSDMLMTADFSWAKPYDDNHLRRLYGDHQGYVRAVWQSYFDLLQQRLIDPVLGWRLVSEAAQSNVLAGSPP